MRPGPSERHDRFGTLGGASPLGLARESRAQGAHALLLRSLDISTTFNLIRRIHILSSSSLLLLLLLLLAHRRLGGRRVTCVRVPRHSQSVRCGARPGHRLQFPAEPPLRRHRRRRRRRRQAHSPPFALLPLRYASGYMGRPPVRFIFHFIIATWDLNNGDNKRQQLAFAAVALLGPAWTG
jgi:hypothetical protein